MTSLVGKVAVVTGSTRGLGRAIAEAFAEAGAVVLVSSRSALAVEQTVAGLRGQGCQAEGLACDVSDPEQVKALAAQAVSIFGRFDVWVNNAGLAGAYGPTLGVPPERFVQVVQTNVLGTYYGSWVAMQHFLPRRRGKLINMLGAGAKKPLAMQSAYGSSKAWVRAFTLALAKEYKDSGVGVFAFQPGLVDTEMLRQVDVVEGYEDRLKAFPTIIRMWANPPEVPARKAVWLASSATDGRTALEVRAAGLGHMAAGVIKEGWRRIARREGRPVEVSITTL